MDKETFSQLALANQRQIYRIALCYLKSSADAEDAMQEALLRAWRRRDTLRSQSLFSTWLTRILINECKTLLRKKRKCFSMAVLPDIPVPPQDEKAMLLRSAFFSLPEKYRVPLVLSLLDGYSLKEIAYLLSLPLGTVKTRIARGKKILQKEVSDDAE